MKNLSRSISKKYTTDEFMINCWNNIRTTLNNEHISREISIEHHEYDKYIHDFEGLLKEMDIPDEHIYPHLLVNDLLSSEDFRGDLIKIRILDPGPLTNYHKLFKEKSKLR